MSTEVGGGISLETQMEILADSYQIQLSEKQQRGILGLLSISERTAQALINEFPQSEVESVVIERLFGRPKEDHYCKLGHYCPAYMSRITIRSDSIVEGRKVVRLGSTCAAESNEISEQGKLIVAAIGRWTVDDNGKDMDKLLSDAVSRGATAAELLSESRSDKRHNEAIAAAKAIADQLNLASKDFKDEVKKKLARNRLNMAVLTILHEVEFDLPLTNTAVKRVLGGYKLYKSNTSVAGRRRRNRRSLKVVATAVAAATNVTTNQAVNGIAVNSAQPLLSSSTAIERSPAAQPPSPLALCGQQRPTLLLAAGRSDERPVVINEVLMRREVLIRIIDPRG